MSKPPTSIDLSPADEQILRGWVKSALEQQLRAERARIVLLAAKGRSTAEIARTLHIRPARVSKWRTRFAAARLAGLCDAGKPGKPRHYDEFVDTRILSLVEQPPPEPENVWTGPLLAQTLGDVSPDYVWKVLRRKGIKLRKRDPFEVETRPFVTPKWTALLALYLSVTASAFVVGTADPGTTATGGHTRSFLRAPSLEAANDLREQSGANKFTLLETLQWALTLAGRNSYRGHAARTLDAFLVNVPAWRGDGELHVFLHGTATPLRSNLQTHFVETWEAFKQQFGFLASILAGEAQNVEQVARLVALSEKFVQAQAKGRQAPFEWHARTSFGLLRQDALRSAVVSKR